MQNHMQLTWRQKLILAGVLRDLGRLITIPRRAAGARAVAQSRRQRRRIAAVRAGLAAIDLAGWLGRQPICGERMAFCREYAALERLGLLTRVNLCGGLRTTHLRLTPAGRKVAEALPTEKSSIVADEPFEIDELELLPLDPPLAIQDEAATPSLSPTTPRAAGAAGGIEG